MNVSLPGGKCVFVIYLDVSINFITLGRNSDHGVFSYIVFECWTVVVPHQSYETRVLREFLVPLFPDFDQALICADTSVFLRIFDRMILERNTVRQYKYM